jgi:dimethylamine/trimethylamine dehydrogenase
VRNGVVDLIGAARPSIADPFLPVKIREGREHEIRECIGCNICYTGDQTSTPIRCTQNPTMGEEYRQGWHPERIAPKVSAATVLVVGGGPAGLEAATWLGKRGYDVVLAEATRELGGRVARESRMPGLAEWRRVVDYRTEQIARLPNVECYLESEVDEAQIREFGADHVCLATGSTWRRDGVGRARSEPFEGSDLAGVLTPDDFMAGAEATGDVVVFDDDHYYMASVIAEKLARDGSTVTYVTPANEVATWTNRTDEQFRIQARLLHLGVAVETGRSVGGFDGRHVHLECEYTGRQIAVAARSLVVVTSRQPDDALWASLPERTNVTRIGDCLAPGTIATAVYAGHRYARELERATEVVFRREHPRIGRRG